MRRSKTQGLVVATATALSALGVQWCGLGEEAMAGIVVQGPYQRAVSRTIPERGVITVLTTCIDCADDMIPSGFDVFDSSGSQVTGGVIAEGRTSSGFWSAWKSDDGFTAGEAYEIELLVLSASGQAAPGRVPITVESLSVPSELDAEFSVEAAVAKAVSGEPSCCVDGPRDSITNEPRCVWPEREASIQLSLTIPSAEAFFGQVVFEVDWVPEGGGEAHSESVLESQAKHYFLDQAEGYCARITAVQVQDGLPLSSGCSVRRTASWEMSGSCRQPTKRQKRHWRTAATHRPSTWTAGASWKR